MATKDLPRIEEEVKEYEDESNVLISITELENLKQEKLDLDIKEEPVVPLTIVKEEDIRPNINIKEETVTPKYTFKSTPFISPIYGIEGNDEVQDNNVMNLENSANYEKFDEEIRKTNEFLSTLKELQKKLD